VTNPATLWVPGDWRAYRDQGESCTSCQNSLLIEEDALPMGAPRKNRDAGRRPTCEARVHNLHSINDAALASTLVSNRKPGVLSGQN